MCIRDSNTSRSSHASGGTATPNKEDAAPPSPNCFRRPSGTDCQSRICWAATPRRVAAQSAGGHTATRA
eukprot:5927637-Alexandrium_andersonii.AAC.1